MPRTMDEKGKRYHTEMTQLLKLFDKEYKVPIIVQL